MRRSGSGPQDGRAKTTPCGVENLKQGNTRKTIYTPGNSISHLLAGCHPVVIMQIYNEFSFNQSKQP